MNEPTSQMSFFATDFTTDDGLALTLMTMWALWTGRAMPDGAPVLLTEEQLIEFWAE